jgi:hypothetical protein
MIPNSGGYGWQTWTTASSNTTSVVIDQPVTISVTPAKPAPKSPLDWLRDQVDEVCALARAT